MDSVFWNFSIMKCCPHIPQEGLAFLCWRNNVIGWQYSTASWFWSRAVIIITFGTHLTYLPPHLVMFTCRHLMFIPRIFILKMHLNRKVLQNQTLPDDINRQDLIFVSSLGSVLEMRDFLTHVRRPKCGLYSVPWLVFYYTQLMTFGWLILEMLQNEHDLTDELVLHNHHFQIFLFHSAIKKLKSHENKSPYFSNSNLLPG